MAKRQEVLPSKRDYIGQHEFALKRRELLQHQIEKWGIHPVRSRGTSGPSQPI